jgi:hypothetical protein
MLTKLSLGYDNISETFNAIDYCLNLISFEFSSLQTVDVPASNLNLFTTQPSKYEINNTRFRASQHDH